MRTWRGGLGGTILQRRISKYFFQCDVYVFEGRKMYHTLVQNEEI